MSSPLGRAALVALALVSAPVAAQTLEQRFEAPPKEVRPSLRWWWPGAAVEDAELRREIALMDATGFAGAEIASFTPNFVALTPEERAVANDYAEPKFFAHVRVAGEAARRLGLKLDYTLGSSWPSGGGFAITPELAFVELAMAHTTVHGGGTTPVRVEIPRRTKRLGALSMFDARVKDPAVSDWAARMDARAKIVAVVAVKGSAPDLGDAMETAGMRLTPWRHVARPGTLDPATTIVLTDRLRGDGGFDWTPASGEWQVFVFKQYASDVGVLGAAGRGPQLILDHTRPEAFAAHAARVGAPLGRRPPGLRASFVDSLELMQDIHWGPDFLAQFRKRRGYDLTPFLPFVLQPGWMLAWGEDYSPPYFEGAEKSVGERVRADYRRTISDLMIEGFVEPFVAWNHQHGLLARFQAHGGPFDIIRGYGLADIPETEDLFHGGDPLFMRFARSGAHLYGRRLVSAESLVWKDRPFDVTPDEMRRRVDLIVAGGVNSLVLHGMNYRFHASDWPGWHAFQPSPFALGFSSALNETNPIWPAMKPLAGYIARLQAVMQAGEAVVPVAYFYGDYGYYVGIEDRGAGKQAAEKAFVAGGYDFDRINPDSIASARVSGGALLVRSGRAYPVLVLPPLEAMDAETAEAIARFAEAGLPIFFADRAPERADGLMEASGRDLRVKRSIAAALASGAKLVPAADIPSALRSAGIVANLQFEGDATDLIFVQRRVGRRFLTFVHNKGDARRNVTIAFPMLGGASLWNPMNGSIEPVSASAAGTMTRVPLSLQPGESALLALDTSLRPRSWPAPVVIERLPLPPEGWRMDVEGHALRKPYSASFDSTRLGDWRSIPELAAFAGRATYRRTIDVPPSSLLAGRKTFLDLGEVYDMATVTVNGQVMPPVIARPFRSDLTGHLRPGSNELVVTVANVPQNSMLDPKAPGYKRLRSVPAGLAGPVQLDILQ